MVSTSFYDFFGGITSNKKTLIISGGFIKNKHIENRTIIGELASSFIKDRHIEWDTFKQIYYENKILNPKYYDKLLLKVNDIILLPIHSIEENELIFLIENIYKAKQSEIMNTILKFINIYKSIKDATKHLFMIYKVCIETLIETFVNLRNEFIDKNKLESEKTDFKEISTTWSLLDSKNAINTSSPILFFSFPPKNIEIDKSIPNIIWHIKSSDVKHKSEITKINLLINLFLNAIEAKQFQYIGYCPHTDINRFKLLLDFPIEELFNIIQYLDDTKYISIGADIMPILDKLKLIINNITNIKYNEPANVTNKTIKTVNNFKELSIPQKINIFEIYIHEFLNIYKILIPYVISKEQSINNISIDINIVSRMLSDFNMLLK